MMIRAWKLLAPLTLILLIGTSGCDTRIVYTSFQQTPEEARGAIRIATNAPIPVTVVGETDTSTTLDIGGYYAVHPRDLKAFVECVSNSE